MNAPSLVLDSRFVAEALGPMLRGRGGTDRVFERAIIDSREARPGDLFVALPGERTDGHNHAAAAVAAGATGCLLGRIVEGTEAASRFYVDDPLLALQTLGAAWRSALTGLDVVGVTGNVGKTTTKLIVAQLLAPRYRVQVNPLNYNNEISVPLCLLELRPESERAVIEHGMYTTGEIALLCRWTRPRVGVVLNVGPVHLERAGSMEAIVQAKRELIEALPADGHAILNADDPLVAAMAPSTAAPVTTFGTAEGARVRGHAVESQGARGFDFTLDIDGEQRRVHVPLPGAHLLSNVLAGIAVAHVDGVPLDDITGAVERLDVPLRLEIVALTEDITLLDDTYNANPASMNAALDLLSELTGRHVALLGDMLELGDESARAHQKVGERAGAELDLLFTIGDLGARIGEVAATAGVTTRHLASKDEAATVLAQRLEPGDAILIKGSNALHLETVVRDLILALNAALEERS
ncbi:MAG: UDP-N-acetylmuramoyl-tripeptide--D-alanyl-D-alanine ligase [Chloroflexi bacterium]|nr:UDP-N-acetylmuramoyl-tripeptide--D-alanyl-D-alanine ligase [Chloroflexota bacterium]MDA1147481.1 UDP-N-acetylmuramoyl-tripeptide--D-alanyl-D-alanine ligase [Chloroflexota bacterium]MQC83026.1 UDP-N-acetylmuramoyl-tripeptide--D-alanyl-D-alanine ligase [Chloroflexota bacterium]